ncbi:MAG: AI-2E family transporter [Polyangia bacterium]|nr:AI-2E family transporter [Polyangia bacterium]
MHQETEIAPPRRRPGSLLLGAAALVVLVAGLRAAAPILVPLLLAGFVAVLCLPLLTWLKRRRVPAVLAVVLVIAAAVLGVAGLALLLGSSVSDFSARIPFYQARFKVLHGDIQGWLQGMGISLSLDRLYAATNPAALMGFVSRALGALASALSNLFLVLLVVLYILGEAASLQEKLTQALASRPSAHPGATAARLAQLADMVDKVQRYLAWKTLISLGTGLALGLWCWLLGVDFAFLWGLVAFLLNYVPNIGSLLAALPPVLLALVQLGPGSALAVAAGYVVANTVFGNVIEPLVLGRKLGLSSLVVILSLILWGFVWGPVGMFLSVPLTVMVRIALEASPSTRFISILMGPAPAREHARGKAPNGPPSDPDRPPAPPTTPEPAPSPAPPSEPLSKP